MSTHTLLLLPIRPRRLRRSPWLRAMVEETHLRVEDLVWPLFVQEGEGLVTPVDGLPGVERRSIDQLVEAAREAARLGIPAVALFPVTPAERKTDDGREAFNPENLMARAIRAIKAAVPEIGMIADVALDPYTTHGHDGLLGADGDVHNDATVAALCQQAVVLAAAGCDTVAPSDMMDGRIGESARRRQDAILTRIPPTRARRCLAFAAIEKKHSLRLFTRLANSGNSMAENRGFLPAFNPLPTPKYWLTITIV